MTLSTLLIQPINPYGIWFVRDLGSNAFYSILGLTGYLGVCLYSLVSHAMQPGARDKLNHMDALYGEPFLALVRKRAVEGSIFRA